MAKQVESPLQQRHARGVSVGNQYRQPVQQQVAGPRRLRRPRGSYRPGGLPHRAVRQTADGQPGPECVPVGLPRQTGVQRLEPPRRRDQQRQRVPAVGGIRGQLGAQQLRLGAPDLIQRPGLGQGEQPPRPLGRTGLVLDLRCAQRPPGPFAQGGRQLRGPFAERGVGSQAAAGPHGRRGAFQLGRDFLVHTRCGMPTMPGAPIGIGIRIGGHRQGMMDDPPLLRRGGPVDREPGQRITEAHPPGGLDEPGLGRGRRGPGPDTQRRRRLPHQHRIRRRLSPRPPAAGAASLPAAAPAASGSCPRPVRPAPRRGAAVLAKWIGRWSGRPTTRRSVWARSWRQPAACRPPRWPARPGGQGTVPRRAGRRAGPGGLTGDDRTLA